MIGLNTPKVSVCIPTFNGAEYLRQAVESVLKQSYQDFEIVIVDNCSTDQTDALIDALLKEGSGCIRFYKNDRNIGLVANLNRCLEHAKGTYIKFLCVDDILLPECIEQMVNALELHPSVKLVGSSRIMMDAAGNKLGITRKYMNRDAIVRGSRVITRCLFGGNYIGEPTAVMFRKEDLKGRFREDMPQLSDMDMWFQLLEQGDFLSLVQPLCAIRSHSAQMTHTNVKLGKLVDDNVKLFEIYSQKPYLEVTWPLVMRHKLLMTYRIWVSRKMISDIKREMILDRYACQWMYRAMPFVALARYLKKQIAGRK